MRGLQLLLIAETLVLAVLVALWWSRSRGALPPQLPPAHDAGAESASTSMQGSAVPGHPTARDEGAPRTATAARAAVAPTGAGASVFVRGRLVAADGGDPPEDAYVHFRRGSAVQRATVSEDCFAVGGLASGTWEVRATADGFARYREELVVRGAPLQAADLALARAHAVDVFVRTPTGEPLEVVSAAGRSQRGLWIVATAQPLHGDLPVTDNTTVGDVGIGRYTSARGIGAPAAGDDVPDGKLQLDRPPPANVALLFRHVLVAQQPIAAGQAEVRFEVAADTVAALLGSVAMRLVDGVSGQPITDGVYVGLSSAQGGGVGGAPDASGRLLVDGVPPGLNSLEVRSQSYEALWDLVRVPASGAVDLGDFLLYPPVTIGGRTVGPDGVPCAAMLQWTALDTMDFPRELVSRRNARADGAGVFEIRAGPRRYVVRARADGGLIGVAVVDGRQASAEPLEIRLARAVEIVARLRDPLAGCTVTVRDGGGVPVAAARIEPRWSQVTLSVPPGDYMAEVHDDADALLQRVPLEARAATLHLEIDR